jgi:hypothetical protein
VYVVVEGGLEYNGEVYDLNKEVEPQQVFFDRTSALRMAETKNVQQLRQYSPLAFCYHVSEISSLDEAELQSRLRESLNDPSFQLSAEDNWVLDPIFPASASDEQMREICGLFDNLHLFEVIESELSI